MGAPPVAETATRASGRGRQMTQPLCRQRKMPGTATGTFARSDFLLCACPRHATILDSLRSATPLWLSSLGTFLFSDKKVPPPAGTSAIDHMKTSRLSMLGCGRAMRAPTFPHPPLTGHLPPGEGNDKSEFDILAFYPPVWYTILL